MRITILHQAISEESTVDEQDVLQQRDAVRDALIRLEHEVSIFPCTLALKELREELVLNRPDVVFNLVESLAGSDRLIGLVPQLLDVLEIPYTGVSAQAIQFTTSKTVTKRHLVRSGLPTAPWFDGESVDCTIHNAAAMPPWPSRWIRKPIYEHASLGMTDGAVIECRSLDDLIEQTRQWQEQLGRPCLAEPYIEGREFNLSLLAGPTGPQVLPLAEIDFHGFPDAKPRIVGFAAKWEESSSEYVDTPRRFDFSAHDAALLEQLQELALRCWQEFGLAGYCRIDFRVDQSNKPWILEINANPCLSPDAGFAAAIKQAGLSYDEAVARIVADAARESTVGWNKQHAVPPLINGPV